MNEKEIHIKSPERSVDTEQLKEISEKHHERLREKLEEAEQKHHEKQTPEQALAAAKELAEDKHESTKNALSSPAERRRGPISKKQLDNSFDSQMSHARNHMSKSSRLFSQLIHTKPVEKVSDIASSTIARPNALFSGSVTAFIAITVLYFVSKHYGYQLSGFETIAAFIIGWIIGILYDYFSVMIRGRSS